MEMSSEVFGEVIVIHAPKELNDDRAEQISRQLSTCGHRQLVLDLDDAEILDSVGLEMLLETQETFQEKGGDLKLVASNPVNRKILEIIRFDRLFEVYDSVLDAVRSFS
jgi:anti-anti-sigma factor